MSSPPTVLVVPESDLAARMDELRSAAADRSFVSRDSPTAALSFLDDGGRADCLLTGVALDQGAWRDLLATVADRYPDLPVVVATADGSERIASETVAAGASRYVPLTGDDADASAVSEAIDGVLAAADETAADRQQYETIVETVPDGVFVLDEEARIVGGNVNGAAMLGFESKTDAIGTPFTKLVADGVVDEAVVDRYRDVVSELLSDETDVEMGRFEFEAVPDGDGARGERIYQASIALRPYAEVFRGTIGILREITERRRRKEELEQFETIVEAIPDAVWAIDGDAQFMHVNESTLELSGFQRSDSTGEGPQMGMTSEGFAKARDVVMRLVDEDDPLGPGATFEHDVVRKDGTSIPCETHLALFPHEAGEFRGAAGITRDVSDRKRLVRRLEVLNRILRHNLRNDLTAVIEYSELVATESDDPAVATYAGQIKSTAYDLVDASDEIRRVQQFVERTGRESETIDLVPLIEEVVTDHREAHPEASIESDLAPSIPVSGGESLRLAIANVVENALVHADGDAPTVEISVEERAGPPLEIASDEITPAEWVELKVADDGPGIPEHERAVVTGDSEVTQLTHSSGIGLWLVDWIVATFGGHVRIEDNEPAGSVVVIALPYHE